MLAALGLGPLDVSKAALGEALAETLDRLFHPPDVDEVAADADNHGKALLAARTRSGRQTLDALSASASRSRARSIRRSLRRVLNVFTP